jgi:hypothetical protein
MSIIHKVLKNIVMHLYEHFIFIIIMKIIIIIVTIIIFIIVIITTIIQNLKKRNELQIFIQI